MLRAVILDVGGTLLGASDLLENMVACAAGTEAHDDLYRQLHSEFFRQIADCRNGLAFKKVVEIIQSSVDILNQEKDNCLSNVSAAQVYWDTFVRDSFVINDADAMLQELHTREIELIIASDADAELLYAQFEKHKWSGFFSKVFISSEVKAYKPNDVFVAALNGVICDYDKSEVIMVGDSEVDIETGKKLGVRTALISRDKRNRYDEDYSISSLLDVLEI